MVKLFMQKYTCTYDRHTWWIDGDGRGSRGRPGSDKKGAEFWIWLQTYF